ncbi:class I SAM-dependent methyltransferase [Vibrio hannami]|uniref:class I SAM-dependent methyltransferase n=1 Tax=Vibrio hannami TaxID=2717094 RepID=UPI00240FC514|nr:class I SAM-dependent methyltransferase [Vibrio hannami]MDG3086653.1 class I SAM-dependent methyltransferase [Vibrio hannami]
MNYSKLSFSSSKPIKQPEYDIPASLLEPMWLRSRESLVEDGLVFDPIAAKAYKQCYLSPECLSGDIDQKQLLHATLTKLCDLRVQAFLKKSPNGWIINVGARLDTRFYRLDNGLCQWVELDTNENLLWREKLFHHNERYQLKCGSVSSVDWLDDISIPENAPVLIVCEQALLDSKEQQVAHFIQSLGRHFSQAQACIVVAGDQTASKLGKKLGCAEYKHGLSAPQQNLVGWLPWLKWIKQYSPLDYECGRWKLWHKLIRKLSPIKSRLTPTVIEFSW